MCHKGIFCQITILVILPLPGKLIIGTTLGEPIVSHRQNLIVRADNAGSHLGIRILDRIPDRWATPMKYSSQLI